MELLEHLKQAIKEYEIVNEKIETKENYITFLRMLILQSSFEDKKEGVYGEGVVSQIEKLNKKHGNLIFN